MTTPQILYLDVETAPSLGYVWGKWQQDVIKFNEHWFMLSFAYKFQEDKKTTVLGLPDYKLYKKNKINDLELLKDLWQVMDKADIIIAHNGDRFDIRKSNARFAFHGLNPPSPFKSIDTLKVARKHFKFDSNKLDDLAQYLHIGAKLPNTGAALWFDCMNGVKDAWNVMKRYNAHDVELLEKVYLRLRPWIASHPNLTYWTREETCPVCQSNKLQHRGWNVSKQGRRARFACQSCGHWSSGAKIERVKQHRIIPLFDDVRGLSKKVG